MPAKSTPDFTAAVWQKIKLIPRGRVSSYREIARALGRPAAARAVGNALNKNPFAPSLPCHRVVRQNGQIGGYAGGAARKQKLLQQEGITVSQGAIANFNKILYKFC